ncbi:MAG: PQQ-binding-like beta-propeller repeat protein [Deltaproteobacteria bacterium]|nr:PQQ-binding-like beta-propeller repeat protein [Deltaproteobacteria bacterium]
MRRASIILIFIFIFASCKKNQPVELLWKYLGQAPSFSTPLIVDDLLVFGNEDGYLTALNKKTGEPRWSYNVGMNIISAPKYGQGKILFGSINYNFYAVDTMGKESWKFTTRRAIKSDPIVKGDTVYFTSYDGHIYAVKIANKEIVWKFPVSHNEKVSQLKAEGKDVGGLVEDLKPGEFSYSSPFIDGDILYVGNLDTYLYAVNINDGTMVFRFKTDDGVTSSPVVENGIVYFGSNDKNIYAVDAKEGKKIYFKVETQGWINSSPRISGDRIYIGSNDKNMYVIDKKSGSVLGKFTAAGPIISIPAIYKNLVIFAGGQGDGTVYFVDINTLKSIFEYKTGGKIESDPVIDGNVVYITSTDRFTYAFRINF